LINKQNIIVAELWDGEQLKCTFRRCVDDKLFRMWDEVVNVASTLVLSDEDDELIWQHTSSGLYSSQSMYSIINFRGITLVYLPAVWNLVIPPRVQLLLWLLSKDKIPTRDNLSTRRKVADPTCVFCSELETANHLLFECVVAKRA
jgi:hypothetical protein